MTTRHVVGTGTFKTHPKHQQGLYNLKIRSSIKWITKPRHIQSRFPLSLKVQNEVVKKQHTQKTQENMDSKRSTCFVEQQQQQQQHILHDCEYKLQYKLYDSKNNQNYSSSSSLCQFGFYVFYFPLNSTSERLTSPTTNMSLVSSLYKNILPFLQSTSASLRPSEHQQNQKVLNEHSIMQTRIGYIFFLSI